MARQTRAVSQPGDIVTKVNGEEVTPEQTLSFLVANIAPGTRIPVELYRDGSRRTVQLTVGKRPTEDELRQQQMFDPDADAGTSRKATTAKWWPRSWVFRFST